MEKNQPIRVAQVIGMAMNGGTESLWINYYRHIDRTKVQFDFLVESESKLINKAEIESLGGNVVLIPSYKNPIKYMKELKKIFCDNKYDIVHSNMNTLSVFTLKAAKEAGIKVRIAHSHSTSSKMEWQKNIIKNCLRPFSKKYATHFFACSDYAGKWLFGSKTFDRGQIKIIKNAIDVERFQYNKEIRLMIRQELGIEENCVVLGNVGRFTAQKNQAFLIDFFKEYRKKNDNSKLVLVGEGPLKRKLELRAVRNGVRENVIFLETTNKIEMYYNAMDLFLFPSLYEGLGITLIEAQANGLNCFASKEVPTEAKVSEKVTFLPNNDVKTWVSAVLNTNTQKRDTAEIDESYKIEKSAKMLEQLYIDCFKER